MAMASNDDNQFETQQHKSTYQLFITLLKWSGGGIALLLILMALFLL